MQQRVRVPAAVRSRPSWAGGASTSTLEEAIHSASKLEFRSSVTLPEEARGRVAASLQTLLADTVDVRLATKQAHWTLRGPTFFARHELFDRVADHLNDQVDDVAERIGALGGRARGTLTELAKASTLKPYDLSRTTGAEHVEGLVDRLSTLSERIRAAIGTAREASDDATEDLLTGQLRTVEEDLWFLESHLEA